MKITAKKVKKSLEKDYGWDNLNKEPHKFLVNEIIEDVISIIDNELKRLKNISIK